VPPVSDAEELDQYRGLLKEWRFTGFIQWKRRAAEWLRENLSNHTQQGIGQLMYEHRQEVQQTPETREEYRERYRFHYDFRLLIGAQQIYIETAFDRGATDSDSTIWVVNIKPA
jgi:hypothetical protein